VRQLETCIAGSAEPLSSEQIRSVLAMNGPAFLGEAYLLIFGRPIDLEGFRTYEAQLISGVSKVSILSALCSSSEARARGISFTTLVALGMPCLDEARPASHITELLRLEDVALVDCAYRTLLRRPPDPSGLNHHVHLLRTGASKMHIVWLLHSSLEGRAARVALPGLRCALLRYGLATSLSMGWWLRRIVNPNASAPFDYRVNE
jgi:hypothetical protein